MRTAATIVLCFLPAVLPFGALSAAAPAHRIAACASHSRMPVISLAHSGCNKDDQSAPMVVQQPLVRQQPRWRQALQKRWRGVLGAVVVSSASMLMRVPGAGAEPAFASTVTTTKTMKKTTKSAAIKRKKAQKSSNGAVGTFVMIGGVGYWAWSSAAKEDEEEQQRIKDETEKMERMSKEFTDIDEGVTADSDLLASLKKRMGNATKSDGEGGEGGDAGGSSGPDAPTGSDSGGGAAVLEPPSDVPEDVEAPDLPSQADVDRLNKLFGMGDAENK